MVIVFFNIIFLFKENINWCFFFNIFNCLFEVNVKVVIK